MRWRYLCSNQGSCGLGPGTSGFQGHGIRELGEDTCDRNLLLPLLQLPSLTPSKVRCADVGWHVSSECSGGTTKFTQGVSSNLGRVAPRTVRPSTLQQKGRQAIAKKAQTGPGKTGDATRVVVPRFDRQVRACVKLQASITSSKKRFYLFLRQLEAVLGFCLISRRKQPNPSQLIMDVSGGQGKPFHKQTT